jgi:hypothetical protein
MCRSNMCCVLLETTILCICRTVCLKLIYGLNGWVFFVWWSFLLLSCHIYVLQTSESKNVKKKIKKLQFRVFFLSNARTGWFTVFGTGTSLLVIPNSYRFLSSSNSKFEFWTGFCGNQSNRWWPVWEAIRIFQSLHMSAFF